MASDVLGPRAAEAHGVPSHGADFGIKGYISCMAWSRSFQCQLGTKLMYRPLAAESSIAFTCCSAQSRTSTKLMESLGHTPFGRPF